MTVRRNDPCPCGSGKKYKHCCLPKQEPISLLNVRAERNHEALLDRLLRLAAELPSEYGMADGLARYFGPRDVEGEPNPDEMLEPLDWVLFGYRSPATGTTLAEVVAQEAKGLSDEERERLREWSHGAIPGFFHVVEPGPGQVHLRRLWDPSTYIVTDKREGLQTGDLLAGWLLPDPSGLRFGYDQMILPPEIDRPLERLVRDELTMLNRQWPSATMHDLYRDGWPRLIDAIETAQTLGDGCLQVTVQAQPAVAGAPQNDPSWQAVARQFAQVLAEHDGGPEEVAGGLRLWWDAVHALQPRVHRPEPWVGALLYLLSHYVYGSDETQSDVAALAGTSAGSVGSRSREIAEALQIGPGDPRYADLLDPLVRLRHRLSITEVLSEMDKQKRPVPPPNAAWPEVPYDDTPQGHAERLIDQAWQATGQRRLKLARQAIDLWPDAADAYVILGNEALNRKAQGEAARHYQAGVEAGERALGPAFFDENQGHFWGLVESRPYMRARFGLARALWLLGDYEAAVHHNEELLRLNPDDNQGVRYVLASQLVTLGDDQRLARLLKEYGDGSATMLYTAALLAFRQSGPGKKANAGLREACTANPHIPAYLLGRHPLPKSPPDYAGIGDQSEAEAYALEQIKGWQATPGAMEWLASRT